MNKVKIISKGWKGYSSTLGGIQFKDGISVEALPRAVIDRLAACVQIVEVDEDDNEFATGSAHRLVANQKERAPVAKPMMRMTEAERLDERRLDLLRQDKPEAIFTGEELEKIVAEKGLKGLREVSDRWGVKHRNISTLIELILRAQNDYLGKRKEKLQKISDRASLAIQDAKKAEDERQRLVREKQAKEDAENSVMSGSDSFAKEFKVGEIVISIDAVVEAAWKRSGASLTGWNRSDQITRDRAIKAELIAIGERFKLEVVPLGEEVAEPDLGDETTEELPDEDKGSGEGTDTSTKTVPDAEPVGPDAEKLLQTAGLSALNANLGTITPAQPESE